MAPSLFLHQLSSPLKTDVKRIHWSRPFAAITALIFLLLGAGDVFGLRGCPHHEAEAGHARAHSEPAGHPPHGDGSDSDAIPEADHEPCSCSGYCPTGATVGPPAEAVLIVGPTAPAPAGLSRRLAERPSHLFAPHFLPYSQAPPVGL